MSGFLTIAAGPLSARICPTGGALVDAAFAGQPILRPYEGAEAAFSVIKAGSFPLVPFGNRIAGNAFRFAGRDYRLAPNTAWDPLHLHGDGWLGTWQVTEAASDRVALSFQHTAEPGAPFAYRAGQTIAVQRDVLVLDLSVENRGETAMPFGLGHHFFFPFTPATTLIAPATSYWSQKAGFLPDAELALPADLDFRQPAHPPGRWVNNGFEGWDGKAEITWPERRLGVAIAADCHFGRYFVFVSDTAFEPAYRGDYFCFEPMTHSADAHNHPDLSGLVVLEPGRRLSTRVTLTPFTMAARS